MRYVVIALLLAMAGCSASEDQNAVSNQPQDSDEHMLQVQQEALEKAKEAAAALEAAAKRTTEVLEQVEQD